VQHRKDGLSVLIYRKNHPVQHLQHLRLFPETGFAVRQIIRIHRQFCRRQPVLAEAGFFRQLTLNQCKISCFPAADAIDEAMNYFDRSTVYDLYRS
jgi:hypothetical protein